MKSIPASTLVNVQPGVIGSGGSPLSLNGVMLTKDRAIPIGAAVPFASANDVAAFFGVSSVEAALASVYFLGFTGKNITPGTLFFAQYADVAQAAWLRGNKNTLSLAQVQAIKSAHVTASAGATFTGTGAGTVLTAASVVGLLSAGDALSGAGVPAGTTILSQLSGSAGGAGTYRTSAPTTSASDSLTASSVVLDVTAAGTPGLVAGMLLTGSGVTSGSRVSRQISGTPGGIGVYALSVAQEFASTAVTGAYDIAVAINGSPVTEAAADLSAATSFSDAAGILGTALSEAVTYDTQRQAFRIASGTTGAASTIGYATGALAEALMLSQAKGATISQGADVTTPAGTMSAVAQATQNWAAFMTLWEPDLSGKLAFAAWSNAQNDRFEYVAWDTDPNAEQAGNTTAFGPLMIAGNYDGVTAIYGGYEKAAFIVGMIASIDFTQQNGRITCAFKGQSGLDADVTDETTAANLIANGYNFYGSYATANQQFTFLQPGQQIGQWKWIDAYVNQIYLNAALQLAILSLMQQMKSLPYNNSGYTLLRAACMDPINQALNFGSIRSGIPLSDAQAAEVNAAAGLPIAQTLTNQGFYLQILPASAQVRGNRQSPPMTLWYTDGGSIQKINLASIDVQ